MNAGAKYEDLRKTKSKYDKEIIMFELRNKKEFADHVHKLRIDAMGKDFHKKMGLAGVRSLISEGKISTQEKKKMWNDAKKIFSEKN